jgi:hypothetical protein
MGVVPPKLWSPGRSLALGVKRNTQAGPHRLVVVLRFSHHAVLHKQSHPILPRVAFAVAEVLRIRWII